MSLFDAIKEKFGDEAEAWLKAEFPKHAIPKDQYNAKAEELKTAKKQIEETASRLTELEKIAGSTEEAKKQFESIKAEYDQYKNGEADRLSTIEKKYILEKTLSKSGAIEDSIDLLLGQFDLSKMELKDGKLNGFEDQLNPLKESRKSLFKQESVEPNTPAPTNTQNQNNNVDPLKQQFDNLTAKFARR